MAKTLSLKKNIIVESKDSWVRKVISIKNTDDEIILGEIDNLDLRRYTYQLEKLKTGITDGKFILHDKDWRPE